MTPSIYDIIRVSLNIANNILFYLPRNLDLLEFIQILSSIKNEIENTQKCQMFLNIKILKSNKKIKTLLIIFGKGCKDIIEDNEIDVYFKRNYDNPSIENLKYIHNIISSIGHLKLFDLEYEFKNSKYKSNNINLMFKFIFDFINKKEREDIKNKAINGIKQYQQNIAKKYNFTVNKNLISKNYFDKFYLNSYLNIYHNNYIFNDSKNQNNFNNKPYTYIKNGLINYQQNKCNYYHNNINQIHHSNNFNNNSKTYLHIPNYYFNNNF